MVWVAVARSTRTMVVLTAALLFGGSGCGLLLDLDPPDLDGGSRDAATSLDAGRDGGPIDGGGIDGGPIDGGTDAGIDGGQRRDASAGDAGDDGGLDDGGMNARDAGRDAAVPCRPDLVDFPMGGSLVVGTLCDEIVVCAGEGNEEDVQAAAPSFSCGPDVATFTCADATCAADPTSSLLDDALIAEICALTQLVPTPHIVCRVFL